MLPRSEIPTTMAHSNFIHTSSTPRSHLVLELLDERRPDQSRTHDPDTNGGVREVEAAVHCTQAPLGILLIDQDGDVVLRGTLRAKVSVTIRCVGCV